MFRPRSPAQGEEDFVRNVDSVLRQLSPTDPRDKFMLEFRFIQSKVGRLLRGVEGKGRCVRFQSGVMGHLLAQLPTEPFQKWLSFHQVSAPHVCRPVPAGGAA